MSKLQDKAKKLLKNNDNDFIVVRDENGKRYQVIPQERYLELTAPPNDKEIEKWKREDYDKMSKETLIQIMVDKDDYFEELKTPPTDQEVWKSIKGHDEKYMVSNYGRVKSLNRLVKKRGGQRIVKEKFLNININNKGYCQVSLTTKHKSKLHFIHRLVAEAFIPNQENKPNVNHKDFNPYNNCVKNLEWCTQKENVKHAIDNGKYENVFKVANQPKPKGFNNHLRKNIVQLDINGNFIKEWEGIKNASKHFKTNDANIIKVCKGKQHTAGGFKWKYADEFYEGKVKENEK